MCLFRPQVATSPLSPRQQQWRKPDTTTGAELDSYCAQHGIAHTVKTVDTGSPDFPHPARLHFVTPPSYLGSRAPQPPSATSSDGSTSGPGPTTLYYFHGGGYCDPLIPAAHIPLLLACADACGARQVVFLEYGLAPRHPYPTQLVQAVAGLRHLLLAEGLLPHEIVVGGDSAGGGLAASLLLHLARPCPYAAPIDLGDQQLLRGALLLSPWVVMGTDPEQYASCEDKARVDWIDRRGIEQYAARWAPRMDEVWAAQYEAAGAREAWEAALPSTAGGSGVESRVVEKVLVVAGAAEVLVDGIVAFARECVRAEERVVDSRTDFSAGFDAPRLLVRCADETHVQPGLDVIMGYWEGSGWRAISAWLKNL